MLEYFRFLSCLLTAIYRERPDRELAATLARLTFVFCILFPVTISIVRLVFTRADELAFLSNHPGMNSYQLRYLPGLTLDLLIMAPIFYAIYFSNAGRNSQQQYDRYHMKTIQDNVRPLQLSLSFGTIILAVTTILLTKYNSLVGIFALAIVLCILSWVLKKYLPAVDPTTDGAQMMDDDRNKN